MKFNNWKLDDLIEHLKLIRHSSELNYQYVTRVSGEIHCFNGERKDGQPDDDDIWEIKPNHYNPLKCEPTNEGE